MTIMETSHRRDIIRMIQVVSKIRYTQVRLLDMNVMFHRARSARHFLLVHKSYLSLHFHTHAHIHTTDSSNTFHNYMFKIILVQVY